MEQTLQALGGILLKAIPTAVLLLILYAYFKAMLFGPLSRVLEQRRELDQGARNSADKSLAEADRKSRELEDKLREARTQIYKEQEEMRRGWLEDQATQLATARTNGEAAVKSARESLASEAAAARKQLMDTSGLLADQIAASVLARRAG
jgi:F-type H+-transporting ATPase subunit b